MRKRSYQNASVDARGEDYLIVLDGKPATTPGGAPLALPTKGLADAIAAEWNEQGERIDPASMMLTALANAAIDRVRAHREDVIAHALSFGQTDLLCYRSEDAELAAQQDAAWNNLVACADEKQGLPLNRNVGISFIEQSPDALLRMQEIVCGFDDFTLAAFDSAATLTGSFVIALALKDEHLDGEVAFAAAHVDELYQADKWGRDPEADQRRDRILAELKEIERFIVLLQD